MLMDSEKKVASSGGQCAGVPKLFAPGPNYPLRRERKYFSIERINFPPTLLKSRSGCRVNAEKVRELGLLIPL